MPAYSFSNKKSFYAATGNIHPQPWFRYILDNIEPLVRRRQIIQDIRVKEELMRHGRPRLLYFVFDLSRRQNARRLFCAASYSSTAAAYSQFAI